MQSNTYKISIFINKEVDTYYAHCPELVGCHSQGDNYDEAQQNIKEAVDLYLQTLSEPEAIDCLKKTPIKKASKPSFDIQLRLNAPQAEKLLLKAGFLQAGSKDNHRIFLKQNQRFILPLQSDKILSQQMVQEVLDLVQA